MSASDESWAAVARDTREALGLLGHPIEPKCLPDETDPCGASFALHAMVHLATIKAICDHQLTHLGAPFVEVHGGIYWHKRAELDDLDERAERDRGRRP
jgi:hypothetical protein